MIPFSSFSILAKEYTSYPFSSKIFGPGWNDFSITIPIPATLAPAPSTNLAAPSAASPLAKNHL